MRIRIRAKPFGTLADIFEIITHNPPVPIDEDFEKTSISFSSLNESTLHCIHGNLVDLSIETFFPSELLGLSYGLRFQ